MATTTTRQGKTPREIGKARAVKFRHRIEQDLCKGCKLCVEFCPKHVLAMTTERLNAKGLSYVEVVDTEGCIGCQACVLICPDAVIELFKSER